jgi:nicotinate-nucleotide adenylyltransferase
LAAAEAARRHFGLGRVLFVPTGETPHKDSSRSTPAAMRYDMALLAVSGNQGFDVSKVEMERPGASYTADTLAELKKRYGKQSKLYFIVGADAMAEMHTWKSPERIIKLCTLISVSRPGTDGGELDRQIESAREEYGAKIHVLAMPLLDISSTQIRQRIQIERPVRYLLPEAVKHYIQKHRLYRGDALDMEAAERRVSTMLSDKRWLHTTGVIGEAVRLAEIYGADRRKAYIAAVFHDCSKEMSAEDKLLNCEKWGIPLDDALRADIDLAHGPLSAEIARQEFNVDDQEILNAIRWHTTGCTHMSLLDKILLVADCIEPNRKNYAGLKGIREAADTDLDKSVALALRMKIDYTVSKNQPVYPLSLKALKHIQAK